MRRDILGRARFRELIRVLGFPPVSVGAAVIQTRAAWERTMPRLSRPERAAVAAALYEDLLCWNENGRERLARWRDDAASLAVGELPADQVSDWVQQAVCFHGDVEILRDLVVPTLAKLPEMVRELAVSGEVAFLATGRSSRAWTSGAGFTTREGIRPARVVVLSGLADAFSLRHELAHIWFAAPLVHPDAELPIPVDAQAGARLEALATTEGWARAQVARVRDEELAADGLAYLWGADPAASE
jgi:hypothetical protein